MKFFEKLNVIMCTPIVFGLRVENAKLMALVHFSICKKIIEKQEKLEHFVSICTVLSNIQYSLNALLFYSLSM